MRVVIHVDASPSIGTGHVVRCLALAAALRRGGSQVTLATDELTVALRARAARLEVEVVRREAAPADPDWVVFDGYHLGREDRDALAPLGTLRLVVDDLGESLDDATLILNQNIYATPAGPSRGGPDAELLAGPAYALLNPEFADVPADALPPPSVARRVLVTMGGADPNNATAAVIGGLGALSHDPQVRVVIGGSHPSPGETEELARRAGFEVVRDVPSLAPHVTWSDVVVTACGTSVLEVACLGRPMIGVVLAPNQELVAAAVEREGLGIVTGRHPRLDPVKLANDLDALRADQPRRTRAAARGRRLVDGRGAGRTADVLRTGPLRLRPASLEDGPRLLEWRMDPEARAASFDSGTIALDAHMAWLREQLSSEAARTWIGMLGDVPVGVVRFNVEGGRATVSVTVAPDRRSAGIGARLISLGCSKVAATTHVRHVDAWIRRENTASEQAFIRAGFRPASDDLADRRRYELALEPMG